MAPSARRNTEQQTISANWSEILTEWTSIELDFQDAGIYGIDLESGILDRRSWRWLSLRIAGLISSPSSRLHRALTKPTPAAIEPAVDGTSGEEQSSQST